MMPLARRPQRFLALFLFVSAVWLIWKVLLQWWLLDPFLQIVEEESALQVAHQRYGTIAAQREFTQSRLTALEQHPVPPDSLLNAKSPEEATAQVMQIIAERIQPAPDHGLPCVVINKLTEPSIQSGVFDRVRVQAELECGIEALAAMLYRFENKAPFLEVESLEVHRLESGLSGQGRLSIRVKLSGLLVRPKAVNP